MRFLSSMPASWNISLFHYRNQGADYGRILVGMQVPPKDEKAFARLPRNARLPLRRRDRQPGLPAVPRSSRGYCVRKLSRRRQVGIRPAADSAEPAGRSGRLRAARPSGPVPVRAASPEPSPAAREPAPARPRAAPPAAIAGAPAPARRAAAGRRWPVPAAPAARAGRCARPAPGRATRCAGRPTAAPGRCRAWRRRRRRAAACRRPRSAPGRRRRCLRACSNAAPSRRPGWKRDGASGARLLGHGDDRRRAEQPGQVAAQRRRAVDRHRVGRRLRRTRRRSAAPRTPAAAATSDQITNADSRANMRRL